MISERTFSDNYSTFWRELLPGGTRYIKFINGSASERISDAIETNSNPKIRSIISQTAFYFVKYCFSGLDFTKLNLSEILKHKLWRQAFKEACEFIDRFHDKPKDYNLKPNEVEECFNIAKTTYRFLKSNYDNSKVVFEPEFPGWGLLNPAKGDILVKNHLIEVKTINGSFGISDIRQILVYGTLNYLTSAHSPLQSFELFNPRLGKRFKDSFDDMAMGIAGSSAEELFNEISRYITDKIVSI